MILVFSLEELFYVLPQNKYLFQALENELANHQFRIDTVLASGQDLIDSNHYASDEIEERCEHLNESWALLMEASDERKQRLGDALESQKVSEKHNLTSGNTTKTEFSPAVLVIQTVRTASSRYLSLKARVFLVSGN